MNDILHASRTNDSALYASAAKKLFDQHLLFAAQVRLLKGCIRGQCVEGAGVWGALGPCCGWGCFLPGALLGAMLSLQMGYWVRGCMACKSSPYMRHEVRPFAAPWVHAGHDP